jgi:hypothetical protein
LNRLPVIHTPYLFRHHRCAAKVWCACKK